MSVLWTFATAAHAQDGSTASAAAAGSSQPAAGADPSTLSSGGQVMADENYVVGPGDALAVTLLDPGASYGAKARIDSDGTVQLPYLQRLKVAGLTARQIAAKVAEALKAGGYYADPHPSVQVVSFASSYVTVLGAAGNQGLFPLDRTYRLSEVVARIGGLQQGGADYVIVTPVHGPSKRYSIRGLATGAAADDPIVAAGDKIYVPPVERAYVTGQVQQRGPVMIRDGMTIQEAIAAAGGITDEGSERGVRLTRKGVTKKLNRTELMGPVQDGDEIKVGEKLF
jgi:polysaccharide export outer membrane protein